MKHLDKSAHMRALVLMRQVDVHIDSGHSVLGAVSTIANRDGVSQVLYSHLIDRNVAIIALILGIFHVILEDRHF